MNKILCFPCVSTTMFICTNLDEYDEFVTMKRKIVVSVAAADATLNRKTVY